MKSYNCVVCIKQVPDTGKVTGDAMKADGTINNIIENWRFADEKDDEEEDYREIYIDRDGPVFVLTGKQLKKIFMSTNFNDMGSVRYLYKYIENKGAIDKLKDMGLQDGDIIRIINYEMEYYDEDGEMEDYEDE